MSVLYMQSWCEINLVLVKDSVLIKVFAMKRLSWISHLLGVTLLISIGIRGKYDMGNEVK